MQQIPDFFSGYRRFVFMNVDAPCFQNSPDATTEPLFSKSN